jgi:hypothetical protein
MLAVARGPRLLKSCWVQQEKDAHLRVCLSDSPRIAPWLIVSVDRGEEVEGAR